MFFGEFLNKRRLHAIELGMAKSSNRGLFSNVLLDAALAHSRSHGFNHLAFAHIQRGMAHGRECDGADACGVDAVGGRQNDVASAQRFLVHELATVAGIK